MEGRPQGPPRLRALATCLGVNPALGLPEQGKREDAIVPCPLTSRAKQGVTCAFWRWQRSCSAAVGGRVAVGRGAASWQARRRAKAPTAEAKVRQIGMDVAGLQGINLPFESPST